MFCLHDQTYLTAKVIKIGRSFAHLSWIVCCMSRLVRGHEITRFGGLGIKQCKSMVRGSTKEPYGKGLNQCKSMGMLRDVPYNSTWSLGWCRIVPQIPNHEPRTPPFTVQQNLGEVWLTFRLSCVLSNQFSYFFTLSLQIWYYPQTIRNAQVFQGCNWQSFMFLFHRFFC